MNIYEIALLDGPNWKSIYVAGTEDESETEGEWIKGGGGRIARVYFPIAPYCFPHNNKVQAATGGPTEAN